MLASLTTGVTGLRSHQLMLEMVGNNLANVNTPAFKSSRVTFSAALSETLRPATGATDTTGGVNAIQRGLGVKTASIDVSSAQGTIEMTGRTLDLAFQGPGYFVVDDGAQDLYTRVGTFSIDADGKLVHSATGFRALDIYGQAITIPANTRLAGHPTENIYITGNLDAASLPPRTEVHTTRTPFTTGGEAAVETTPINPVAEVLATDSALEVGGNPAVAGDALNDLDANTADYVDGDVIELTGTAIDGSDVTADFTYGAGDDGTTVGELRDAISAAFAGATCTLDGDGNLMLTADDEGAAELSLALADAAGATGATTWPDVSETVAGSDGLDSVDTPYVDGDQISITGIDAAGNDIAEVFVYGAANDGTTLGDLRDFISSAYPDAACTLDADGNLVLTADEEGPADLAISIVDEAGATGSSTWTEHGFSETTPGDRGDTWNTTISIFDTQGKTHILSLEFEMKAQNTWDLTASIPENEGTLVDSKIEGITFNEDGSFGQLAGVGEGDPGISIDFPGLGVHDISLDFGTSGGFDGLTQYGGRFSAAPTRQDGYQAGTLSTISVREDGGIQGTFTNGQVSDIATLQVATFSNPEGLRSVRDGFFASTPNSGLPQPGQAGLSGAGKVIAGALEGSNVDVAYEFTRLIVAQRGFQVNSRTISATDEVLEELARLIR
ncbi:MAG: flagellar hook-basal body complex protein [Candidatus Brocadiia bacterium]